jgi:hypothetical protein
VEGSKPVPTPNSSSPGSPKQPAASSFPTPDSSGESGLLEQPILLIRPAGLPGRLLLETPTAAVGFATWQRGCWVWRPALRAHEQEQAPLVFTVRRRGLLLRRWEVSDADDDFIGVAGARCILDRWSRPAMVVRADGIQGGRILGTQGELLAEWSACEAGVELRLHPLVQHDPFAKMLVLAAVLVHQA